MFAVFGKARLAKLIFALCFKINGGDIIKNNAYLLVQYFEGMLITDLLNLLFLRVVKLVKIAVNYLYIDIYKLIF